MKKIKPNFWKKGWIEIDRTRGGYAETSHEYFEAVPSVPLLKAKKADVWYIGSLAKGQKPEEEKLIFDEKEAKYAFEGVKQFQDNELRSNRNMFSSKSAEELELWIETYGDNFYLGDSLYLDVAKRELERARSETVAETRPSRSEPLATMVGAAPMPAAKPTSNAAAAKSENVNE